MSNTLFYRLLSMDLIKSVNVRGEILICQYSKDAERIATKGDEVKMIGRGWSPCWRPIKTIASFAVGSSLTSGSS